MLMRRYVFMLILVLLPLSCVGCIALPMPGLFASKRTDTNNNFFGKIGDENSSAPLRVGVSTRAEVERVLGKADDEWRFNTETWFYRDWHTKWIVVYLWPFIHGGPIQTIEDGRSLRIEFNPDGRIGAFAIWE
jgi:hypothetical protein